MENKINLLRKHKPLPNKWIIKNQTQYETAQYLMEQETNEFNPCFLVTFHYYHPDENDYCHKRHNNKTNKKRFYNSLWKEAARDAFVRRRRLNEFELIRDHTQIKNVILKELYGVKRLNKEYKYEMPYMLFFYEKGKSKVKYHTHLLLSYTAYFKSGAWRRSSLETLEEVFNNRIRPKRKCFSNWKNIHIEKINDVRGALSYCNKEPTSSNYSIDYQNSNLVTPTIH